MGANAEIRSTSARGSSNNAVVASARSRRMRSALTVTCASATRASDCPMTRVSCNSAAGSGSCCSISARTVCRISTSARVKIRSSGPAGGKPSACHSRMLCSGSTPARSATSTAVNSAGPSRASVMVRQLSEDAMAPS